MISCCTNTSISSIGKLSDICCYSKVQSCGQRTSNLIFFSIKKRRTAGGMRLVSTDMVVVVFVSLLIILAITNIALYEYQLLIYILYADI